MTSTITQYPLPKYVRVNSILNPGSFTGASWEVGTNVTKANPAGLPSRFTHTNGAPEGGAFFRANGDILEAGSYRARAHFAQVAGPAPTGLTISVRNGFEVVGPFVSMTKLSDNTWFAEWDFSATVRFTSSLLIDFLGAGRGEVVSVQSYAIIESTSTAQTPLLPPFDGGGPNSEGITHSWVSTAFASPSIEYRPDTSAFTVPLLVVGYETAFTSNNVLHNVIGKDAPVPTFRRASARSGTLSLLYADEGAAQYAAQLHRRPSRFGIGDSERPTIYMIYAVTGSVSLRLDPETQTMWILDVDYAEVYPS